LTGSTSVLLDIRDLTIVASGRTGTRTLIDHLSLQVEKGELIGVVGETGSGKTILIRALMGELPAGGAVRGGTLTFKGRTLDIGGHSDRHSRHGMSVILSDGKRQLNPLEPVQQQVLNAVLAHKNVSRQAALDQVQRLLAMVQLTNLRERLHSYPHELSGGMAQRIFVAMSLASSPEFLLADEPTFGLDVTVQKQVIDLIAGLVRNQGMTMLLVTRDLGIVAQYTDRVAVMRQGEVIEMSSTKRFFEEPRHPYSRQLLESAWAALSYA
jgi:peptide/nickel transport system ATP-binding protein